MKIEFSCKLVFFILILCAVLNVYDCSWGQEKNLLLYASNTTFLPEIERILGDLHDYNTGEPIFSGITNLNKWSINRLELGKLDQLIRFYESSPELRRKTESALRADSVFRELVGQSDIYIRIEVLWKLSLLEFQFIITDSLPKVKTGEFPVIVTNESRFLGFVVDISRQDYQYQLENSLKRLFPECNRPPIPIIKVNKVKNEDGYYYFGLQRTAILDATESYDFDTPPERLQFHWIQQNPKGIFRPLKEDEIVPIHVSTSEQVLKFTKKGEYRFALTIYDGINKSREEVINIRVINPPYLLSESSHSIESDGWLSDRRFAIPVSMILEKGTIAELKIVRADVMDKRAFPEKIFFKDEYKPLHANKYKAYCVSTAEEAGSDTLHYDIVVKEESGIRDYQYKFHVTAETDRCLSDTLVISVDFKNRRFNLINEFTFFHFFGGKVIGAEDTIRVSKRFLAFRPSIRATLYKKFSIDAGFVIPLFEENLADSLEIYDTEQQYFSLNLDYWSFLVYWSGRKLGAGCSFNAQKIFLGFPLKFEIMHHGSYLSTNITTGFKLSGSSVSMIFNGMFWGFYISRYVF